MSELCVVWEESVRISHTFLSTEAIGFFAPFVRNRLKTIEVLYVVRDGCGKPCGFMGLGEPTMALPVAVDAAGGATGDLTGDAAGNAEGDYAGRQKIEMLFLHPSCMGKGIGRKLVALALKEHRACFVDVNEQNPQAVGFYLHLGFWVAGRSSLDASGKPFPILHLQMGQDR